MPKQNLFAKKLKKQFLSINDSIENYFNKLKFIKSNLKKTKIMIITEFFCYPWMCHFSNELFFDTLFL